MKKEDIDFLKNLQAELKKQDNDSLYSCHQANPRYWGIMERKLEARPSGYGDPYIVNNDGDKWTLDEFVEYIDDIINTEEYYTEEDKAAWEEIDKDWFSDVLDFAIDYIGDDFEEMWFDYEEKISEETGCFLTKSAAQEYLDKFGYNHTNEARTYAMTAYRNFEFGKLLNILTNMNFNDIKVDNSEES